MKQHHRRRIHCRQIRQLKLITAQVIHERINIQTSFFELVTIFLKYCYHVPLDYVVHEIEVKKAKELIWLEAMLPRLMGPKFHPLSVNHLLSRQCKRQNQLTSLHQGERNYIGINRIDWIFDFVGSTGNIRSLNSTAGYIFFTI